MLCVARFRKGWNPRGEALKQLNTSGTGVVFASNRTGPEGVRAALHRYAFAISPVGHGPDCYRTWETMWGRAVPIVKTTSLDPMYRGLPVRLEFQR